MTDAPAPAPPKSQPIARRMLLALTLLVFVPVTIATALGYAGVLHWSLDLASHFRLQWAVLSAACLVLLLIARAWRCSVVCLVVLGLNAWPIAPLYMPADQPTGDGPRMRIMQFNTRILSNDFSRLQAFIDTHEPDVIVLEEVNNTRMDFMQSLSAYERIVLTEDAPYMRIGVWLRRASDVEVTFTQQGIGPLPRGVVCGLSIQGRAFNLMGLHPFPPTNRRLFDDRQRLLAGAAKVAEDMALPAIVVGDLNMTRFSAGAAPLEQGGLRDASLGLGYSGTWPSQYPWTGMIGIDHVWVSDAWRVEQRFVGPDLGSDHRPVICDVTLTR